MSKSKKIIKFSKSYVKNAKTAGIKYTYMPKKWQDFFLKN